MKRDATTVAAALAATTSLLLGACGSDQTAKLSSTQQAVFEDPFDVPTDKVPDAACDGIMNNNTGENLGGKILGRLNDPLARLVLRPEGSSCPTSYGGILDALRANPANAEVSCDMESMRTMFVTERGQLNPTGGFRTVTAIDCGNDAGILFSSSPGQIPNGGFLEIIAFDAQAGVFNYYDRAGGRMTYHGHSAQFVADPPTGTGNTPKRCGGCHTGGGLVMKELAAPWLHWEGDTDTPGTDEIVNADDTSRELFGRLSDGIEMESIVRQGNRVFNETRLNLLKDNTDPMPKAFQSIFEAQNTLNATQKLLEPLFCGTEVNLDTASSSPQDGKQGRASFGPLSGPVFPQQLGFGSINFDAETYDQVIRAAGQRVVGVGASGFVDTHFALPHISRAAADDDFINKLRNEGIIDNEFIEDVLAVDFTRPMSNDRCELLQHVPDVAVEDRNPEGLRAAILTALKTKISEQEGGGGRNAPGEATAEQELLNNLGNPDDDPRQKVRDFVQACQQRSQDDQAAMVRDYMAVIEVGRESVAEDGFGDERHRSVFEFPGTLARTGNQNGFTNNEPTTLRLNPVDCTLANTFVPVAEFFNRATSCAGRCGLFDGDPNAACQCDEDCEQFGNCCDDFKAQCEIPECTHSVCETGEKLVAKCADTSLPANKQDCAAKVCAQDDFCCENEFDEQCIRVANDVCDAGCSLDDDDDGPIILPEPPVQPLPFPAPPVRRDFGPQCKKVCTNSKACGKTCIPMGNNCNTTCDPATEPGGCACNLSDVINLGPVPEPDIDLDDPILGEPVPPGFGTSQPVPVNGDGGLDDDLFLEGSNGDEPAIGIGSTIFPPEPATIIDDEDEDDTVDEE